MKRHHHQNGKQSSATEQNQVKNKNVQIFFCGGDVTIPMYPLTPMSLFVTNVGYPLTPYPGDVIFECPQMLTDCLPYMFVLWGGISRQPKLDHPNYLELRQKSLKKIVLRTWRRLKGELFEEKFIIINT